MKIGFQDDWPTLSQWLNNLISIQREEEEKAIKREKRTRERERVEKRERERVVKRETERVVKRER